MWYESQNKRNKINFLFFLCEFDKRVVTLTSNSLSIIPRIEEGHSSHDKEKYRAQDIKNFKRWPAVRL